MTKQEKDSRVPLWERMNLTLEEAAAYTGIGTDKLRELSNREMCIRDRNCWWIKSVPSLMPFSKRRRKAPSTQPWQNCHLPKLT